MKFSRCATCAFMTLPFVSNEKSKKTAADNKGNNIGGERGLINVTRSTAEIPV